MQHGAEGVYTDLSEVGLGGAQSICANWKLDKRFDAAMEDEWRKELLKGWKKVVKCALVWAEE